MLSSVIKCGSLALVFAVFAAPAQAQPATPEPGAFYPTLSLEEAAQRTRNSALLTLHFQSAPLQSVLDAIEKQSGMKIDLDDKSEAAKTTPVTLNLERQPLWATLSTLAAVLPTNFLVRLANPEMALPKTTQSHALRGLTKQRGPFLFVINDIQQTSSHTIRFATPLAGNIANASRTQRESRVNTTLGFNVFADPILQTAFGTYGLEFTEVRDNKGKQWRLPSFNGYDSDASFQNQNWVALEKPADAGDTLSVIRGTYRTLVAGRTEFWEIPNALNLKTAEKTVESNGWVKSYQFGGMAKVTDVYQVNLTIQTDTPAQSSRPAGVRPLSPQRLNRINGHRPYIQVFDSKGYRLTSRGASSRRSADEYAIEATFSEWNEQRNVATPPFKVVVEIPSDFSEIEVPFEFTDVPLP
jgi:hypothetical protein